ncbi:energy transducer TonB [Christiangramia salexigens]|uniref:TonB C-terminal domain-containing protein n=1 Tax=Christiangramia salexigens TaxID=1913577 RepID=A0A1L3J5I9_9FLAO|nr:energy transducer TonB [Christiangramia salexigens]APG60395.1 hypothetical protein LPB144_08245 [Christiangramia salexigens]
MKNLLLLGLAIVISAPLFSQNFSINEVDEPPRLKNSCENDSSISCFESSLFIYVNKNIDIMNLVKGKGGTAYAQFIITPDGDVTDIKLRSNSNPLQKEAERLVKKLKFTKPAVKDGQEVAVKYTLPVKFQKKTYDGYDEYFQNKESEMDFASLTDVAQVPEIGNCKADAKCLQTTFKDNFAKRLEDMNFNKNEIKNLKFTFVVTKNAEIKNILVMVPNKRLEKATKSILNNLKVHYPALDEDGQPMGVRLVYKFETT